MQESAFDQYISEIQKYDLLTFEEEQDLAKKYAEGDKAAGDKLYCSNLRLVVKVAKGYTGQGVELMDLIQEGNIGLITALNKFDFSKGYKFSTYATWWIRQAITKALTKQSRLVRLPARMVEDLTKQSKLIEKLQHELGRDPTTEEIADASAKTTEEVEDLLLKNQAPISLDEPAYDDDSGRTLHSLIAETTPDEAINYDEKFLAEEIEKILLCLKDRERLIIKLRYGLGRNAPMTLKEISESIGLSLEATWETEQTALKKIRSAATRLL